MITSDHGTPFPLRQEGCCCFCWQIVMWVDNWKKGIFYLLLSVPVFLEGMRIILGMVSGKLATLLLLVYVGYIHCKTIMSMAPEDLVSKLLYTG